MKKLFVLALFLLMSVRVVECFNLDFEIKGVSDTNGIRLKYDIKLPDSNDNSYLYKNNYSDAELKEMYTKIIENMSKDVIGFYIFTGVAIKLHKYMNGAFENNEFEEIDLSRINSNFKFVYIYDQPQIENQELPITNNDINNSNNYRCIIS